MSALETIKMKLEVNPATFEGHLITLRYDPRHGTTMPFVIPRDMFLEDARAWSRANPPQMFKVAMRDRAKSLLLKTFWWTCPEHGRTMFHTVSGKCAHCYRESKRPQNPARIAARSRGAPAYKDNCVVHGPASFSTARGLCLYCYNTLGQPRPLATNPLGFYVAQDGNIQEVR